MSSVKTVISQAEVEQVLAAQLPHAITGLVQLKGGELSQALGFQHGDEQLVVRFAQMDLGFSKDAYAAQHFAGPDLLIPRMLKTGRTEQGLFFAITERVPGVPLVALDPAAYQATVPSLLTTLDAIHAIPIDTTGGAGHWHVYGTGVSPTWQESLLKEFDQPDEGFYAGWHSLFDTSFLERSLVERIHGTLSSLLEYCPDQRWLLHGDYGFDNVLVHDTRISGVIDWANSKYGDFVYDLAWLNFWPAPCDLVSLAEQFYQQQQVSIPYFHERLACYRCSIGLDGLKFAARSNQPILYGWIREQVLKFLDDFPSTKNS